MLKLRDIRAVITVADGGSISRAAARLNLSQPAVTHAVKRVEDEIGFKLFDRSHSGMTPTAVGELVVRRASSALRYLVFDQAELEWAAAVKRLKPKALATFEKTVRGAQLRTLVELAECRDADCAAKRMGVTAALVNRRLREMEAVLGAPIFFRRGDTLMNTPLGDVLVRRANLVLSELRILHEEVRQFMGRTEGRVVVGTLPSAQTILVPRTIAELSRTHPDVRITMVDKPYDDLVTGLNCGTIDVIIGSVRAQAPDSNIRDHALFQNTLAVFARSGHRILEKKNISASDLWNCKWVMPSVGAPSRDYFEKLFAEHGAHFSARYCRNQLAGRGAQSVDRRRPIDDHVAVPRLPGNRNGRIADRSVQCRQILINLRLFDPVAAGRIAVSDRISADTGKLEQT